jgi:hypothetical protein
VVKELFQYVFVIESQNYKENVTMFIAIKAVRNSCVLIMSGAAIFFADSQEEIDTISCKKTNAFM